MIKTRKQTTLDSTSRLATSQAKGLFSYVFKQTNLGSSLSLFSFFGSTYQPSDNNCHQLNVKNNLIYVLRVSC